MCDGRATWQIGNLHRQAVLAWNVSTRGRFMSVSSMFSIAGYLVSSAMFKKLGNATAFEIGVVLSACWNAASALCTSGWHFFALIPFNSLSRGLAPIAISTATTLEGTRQGMAQGELQGARSNLQTIMRIFAPLVKRPSQQTLCCLRSVGRRFALKSSHALALQSLPLLPARL